MDEIKNNNENNTTPQPIVVNNTTPQPVVLTKEQKRAKRLANLIPVKKGGTSPRKGKFGPQMKDILRKKLIKEQSIVEQIVNTIISGSISGDNKKIEYFAKMNNEPLVGPEIQVNTQLNNNTGLMITDEDMEYVREFIKNRQING